MASIKYPEVLIAELKPAEYNPRQAGAREIEQLKASIKEFGLVDPIIVNVAPGRKNIIIGGHFRVRVAKELGFKMVPVVYVDIPDIKKEQELNLRLNKNLGLWDFDLLADFDEELLKEVGFESEELDSIFQLDAQGNEDKIPEPKKTNIKRGEIFRLGRHRVMCGDSTDREDAEKLMDGKKGDMIFTSPPYNLGDSIKLRGNNKLAKKGNCYQKYNDKQEEGVWLNLMNDFYKVWIDHSEYLFINIQSLAGNRTALWNFLNTHSNDFCDVGIWNKSCGAPATGRNIMTCCFEFIFIFTKIKPSRNIRIADFKGTVKNVFDIPPQRNNESSDIHGATFPIKLPGQMITIFTKRNTMVTDPFMGTGTTLIACEQTNRICYGMEIDPIYCQVIIDRWQEFTGKKAEKVKC